MGCFDTVMVPCPVCRKRIGFQSKSGPCDLAVYQYEDAPADVLEDVNRHAPYTCDECSAVFSAGDKLTAERDALRARVADLEEQLSHATAEDGDWLSKASRRMCDTVMRDRDAERQRNRDLRAEVERLRAQGDEEYRVWADERDALRERNDWAHDRIEQLHAALRRYGQHADNCHTRGIPRARTCMDSGPPPPPQTGPCTCGLDKVLDAE
jgi:hypothetical protein